MTTDTTLPAWAELTDADRHIIVVFLRTVELEHDLHYVAENWPLQGRFAGVDPHVLADTYADDYAATLDDDETFWRLYDYGDKPTPP